MIKTRPSLVHAVSLAAFSASLVGLAGCNPIGGGTGPIAMGLTVNGPDGTANATTGTVYECIRGGVTATLTFDNGAVGVFTERVTWSSDNPAVVRVSNTGTEPVPGSSGLFFGRGVLTPVAPGVATITAQFSGLSDTIVVTVRPAPNMIMEQREIGTGLPRTLTLVTPPTEAFPAPVTHLGAGTPAPLTRQRMAPRSSVDLTILADLDGVPTRVDQAALWTFDAAPAGATTPNSDIATIDTDGVITTGKANVRPLVARASFQPCARSLATAITVSPIQTVSLVPEFGSQSLIVPNTERYFALANFGDGPEQDISATTSYASGATGTANFVSAFIGLPNLLSSIAASDTSVLITATTPDPDEADATVGPVISTIPQTVIADSLIAMDSVRIEPQNPVAIAGSSMICPLRVIGMYAGPGNPQQDITRRASFVSATPSVGVVSSVPRTSGQVSVGGRTAGSTVVTATVIDGTVTRTAMTTYTLVAPGTARPPEGFCGESLAPLLPVAAP